MLDSRTIPDDKFGFSVYTLVALADADQVRKVADARAAIGMTRATIDAHVTIRGTFCAIESLDELRSLLRSTASGLEPANVEFSKEGWRLFGRESELHTMVMPCEMTPGLVRLNAVFDELIRSISTNLYPSNYRAHLTLYQDCTDEQIEKAQSLVGDVHVGSGFVANSVQLMGRVGPAFGGRWEQIESFPLNS